EVAIKIIRSDLVHDTTARKRFLREAEVNAHLKHEHILPLFEFGEEQGRLFLVTPYISGGTLSRRLQAGPLALSEVYQLFTALVKAVAYIHRRGVIHRDLKPNNILLDKEGNSGEVYVRLIDFGIASIQGMEASPPLTTAGSEVGTVAYMAPERLSGIAAPSNDIFSLGVILYQMLAGQLPSADHRVSLPQPLEYVVNHCIATLPEERFATAEDVLNAFEYAYQYLNSSPTSLPVQGRESTANEANEAQLARNLKPQVRSAHHATDFPAQPAGFYDEDYASPTVNFDIAKVQDRQHTSQPVAPGKAPRVSKSRRSPFLAILTILVVFLLLATAGLFFFTEVQPSLAVKANVNFGPQVLLVKRVFHVKGRVSQQSVDVGTATIPVNTLSSSKDGSLTGQTTGQSCIVPPVIGCQQVVAQSDMDNLSAQLRQKLDSQISADLRQQIKQKGGTLVGSIQFTDTSATANPPVGENGTSVTVTINGQQGQAAYISSHDAQDLARQLLQQEVQKLGANFTLLNSLIQIGQPVVKGINSNGDVSIDIAAAGDTQYHFPAEQLQSIQNAIKNMKEKDAVAFLKRQQGVDANSITIHLSSGNTMPGDPQDIKIITINPVNYPAVFLPKVS
ncbi:MAG TPA: serine/threonine-protein kinase, partial [Ktedonobacteraceae bacterium]|nr:serine/threonine-protein kinase [Ktedonobacteraceae bacterium]